MRIKITSQTRAVVLPQIIEVSDAEAHRLIMLGCAEPLVETKETPEDNIIVETRETPEETKDVKEKKTRKGKK